MVCEKMVQGLLFDFLIIPLVCVVSEVMRNVYFWLVYVWYEPRQYKCRILAVILGVELPIQMNQIGSLSQETIFAEK